MRPYVQKKHERKIEQDPERRKPCECVAVGVIRLSAYGFDSGDFEMQICGGKFQVSMIAMMNQQKCQNAHVCHRASM